MKILISHFISRKINRFLEMRETVCFVKRTIGSHTVFNDDRWLKTDTAKSLFKNTNTLDLIEAPLCKLISGPFISPGKVRKKRHTLIFISKDDINIVSAVDDDTL